MFAATDKDADIVKIKVKDHPTLGVIVKEPEDALLKERHLKGGAEIVTVLDGSVAEKIGLQEGDIITEFDGQPISDPEDLKEALKAIKGEKTVEIVVNRKGNTLTFEADLKPGEPGEIHIDIDKDELSALWPFLWWRSQRPAPEIPFYFKKGGYLGVKVQELSEQLKKYFQVDHGVLVTEVLKDSPAEKAGIEAGDVILKIADKRIDDYQDLLRTVNFYDPGDRVRIVISRRGKEKTLEVTLGKRKKTREWHFRTGPNFPFKFKPQPGTDWHGWLERQLEEIPRLL